MRKWDQPKIQVYIITSFLNMIANEPAERLEAAENSAARRMAYAKKFSIELSESVTVRCKM